MTGESKTKHALKAKIVELQTRLEEVEEALTAIRDGEVDAIVVGEQVYLLEKAGTSSNRFRGEVLAQIDDAVIAMDNDLRVTYLNPAAERQYGVTAAESLGRLVSELFEYRWLSPEDETATFAALEATGSWRGENIHITRDGVRYHVESVASRLRDEKGTPIGLLAVIRDIGERKRAEAEHAQLVAIIESSVDAIYSCDFDGRVLSWNKGAMKLYGWTAEEIIGQPIKRLIPPDRLEKELNILERLRRSEPLDHFETVRLKKDGTKVDVSITVSPIKDKEGRVIGASKVARDITERKKLEEALRRSEANFRRLLNKLPAAAYTCDATGLITYFNQQAAQLWGREPKLNDPEDRYCGSFKLFTLDGEPLSHDRCWMALALEEDDEYNGQEIIIERPDGSRISALAHANPIHDESGRVIGAMNVLVDISERKRAEIEREELLLREKSARAEAQAASRSKDEFISLVSHELRSPLNSIIGYNTMLRSNLDDPEQVRHASEIIERNARTQLRLIEDLLDIARVASGKLRLDLQSIDLVPVLAEALNGIRPAAEARGIELRARYDANPELVNGDPIRLQQVVGNLLSNAVKFTPQGGRVELRLEPGDEDICIVVSDTGKGIEAKYLPHVFDRFSQADSSSSRRVGGLGLGLALVKNLVALHGGSVTAASEGIGFGAAFTVKLPRAVANGYLGAEPPALLDGELRMIDPGKIEGVHVLAIDDQPEARAVITDCLERYGALVTTVASGNEALTLLFDTLDVEWPDVLICDIAMPEEDGWAVMKRIRAFEGERSVSMSHRIPAIALTSLSGRENWVRALSAGFNTQLPKPAEPEELVTLIYSLTQERRRETSLR
jgi:PAS domain S-box-containing protein